MNKIFYKYIVVFILALTNISCMQTTNKTSINHWVNDMIINMPTKVRQAYVQYILLQCAEKPEDDVIYKHIMDTDPIHLTQLSPGNEREKYDILVKLSLIISQYMSEQDMLSFINYCAEEPSSLPKYSYILSDIFTYKIEFGYDDRVIFILENFDPKYLGFNVSWKLTNGKQGNDGILNLFRAYQNCKKHTQKEKLFQLIAFAFPLQEAPTQELWVENAYEWYIANSEQLILSPINIVSVNAVFPSGTYKGLFVLKSDTPDDKQ